MNKILLKSLLVAALLAGVLVVVGQILAAGPDPDGNNPWDSTGAPPCVTNSGARGHELINTNSGNTHCFAD